MGVAIASISGSWKFSRRQSIFRQGPNRIQLIRVQPYPAAGWALVYHDWLIRTEFSPHHHDVRISWAINSRRRGNQHSVTGRKLVD